MNTKLRAHFAAILVLFVSSLPHAQPDSFRALIGTWQGRVDVRSDPERALGIKSIVRKGDRWIADMHYGTTGMGLSHLSGRVNMAGDAIMLTFTTSADNPAELRLVSERELRGTLKVRSGTGGRVDREIRLDKTSE
ncbi:MAG: hypothetical protein Q8S00_16525 [Deltaproteobacteria bacterium]|nr:hypothetical protein [Deltaproteobacteria bacterium]